MFKVGDRIWIKDMKEFGIIQEIKGDDYHSDLESGIDFSHFDNIHQTADDMFEEMGFTKEIDSKYDEVYSNHYGTIIFDTNSYVMLMNDKKVSPVINIKIHQAIHQKMIEMGWIE